MSPFLLTLPGYRDRFSSDWFVRDWVPLRMGAAESDASTCHAEDLQWAEALRRRPRRECRTLRRHSLHHRPWMTCGEGSKIDHFRWTHSQVQFAMAAEATAAGAGVLQFPRRSTSLRHLLLKEEVKFLS